MKLSIGAGGAIIKDKKILLVKRVPTKKQYPNHWTFPAGRINPDEDSLEKTAVREVKEEVNLDFTIKKRFNFYEKLNGDVLNISHVFLGDWSGELKLLEEEATEMKWFSYDDTKDLELAFAYRETLDELHENGLI